MEPRPQRPRPTPGTTQGTPASAQGYPAGGPGPQPGYAELAESRGFIAPPRTEYDYSPLDLAPPAQRRKRQLVVGILAALALIVIGGLAVFGYLLTRDDKTDQVALLAPTQTAEAMATSTAAANQVPGTPVAQGDHAANSTATQPAGAPTTASTAAPTQQSASSGGAPSEADLKAMLPEAAALPVAGLDVVQDSNLTRQQVIDSLGGGRTAEQNLEQWGWSGNASRSFSAADPSLLDPGATTNVVISVHGFSSPESAQAALTFFSDILVNSGYEEVQAPALGDKVRLLKIPNEDGSTNVALYVTKGNVMYRIGGSSVGGDPTEVVLQVATTIFGAGAGQ